MMAKILTIRAGTGSFAQIVFKQLKCLFSSSQCNRTSSSNASSNASNISNATIKEFQKNGVVCIRGAFNKDWLDLAHKGIEKNFASPSEYCDWLPGEDEEGIYFNDYLNCDKIDEIGDYVKKSPAAGIAGLLMQSKVAVFYHEHVFIKKGAHNRVAPWHHDQAYYPLNGMENCTVWMPTTPVSKETSLKFVKGSHLWGKWFRPKNFGSLQNYPKEQSMVQMEFEEIPDINENKYDILSWELEPGDCLAFHMKTLHATYKSSSAIPRYVLATRWVGDDAVLAARPWKTSPPAELLPNDLKIGGKFSESQGFPIIWKRSEC